MGKRGCIQQGCYDCGTLVSGGMLSDLRNYGYINLNKNWWDQAANDQLTIYDRTYFKIGDEEHVECAYILVEALAHGSDIVMEGFYEKNLHGKSIRDEESYETLDIIFAKKVFDLGYYYNVGSYRWNMFTRFRDGQTTFASYYAEQEVAANKRIK